MSSQIPPSYPVPDDDRHEKNPPAGDITPYSDEAPVEPPEDDSNLEVEDYKLPPMEPPAPIREPRIPGA